MKYKAILPIGAAAVFEMESDSTPTKEEFLENCDRVGYLCHQCSSAIETDFEILDEVFENKDFSIFEDE